MPRPRPDIQNQAQSTSHPPPRANHQLPSSVRGVGAGVLGNSRMKSTNEMSHNNNPQQMLAVGVNHGSRHLKQHQQLIECGSEQMTAASGGGESQQQLQVRRNPQQQAATTAADRPQQQIPRGSGQQHLRAAGEAQPYSRNIPQQNSASQRNSLQQQQQPNVFNYFPQQSNF